MMLQVRYSTNKRCSLCEVRYSAQGFFTERFFCVGLRRPRQPDAKE